MHVIAKCFLHFYSAYLRFYHSISLHQSLKVFKSYKCMQRVEEDVFLLIFISIYLIIDTNSNSTTMLPKKNPLLLLFIPSCLNLKWVLSIIDSAEKKIPWILQITPPINKTNYRMFAKYWCCFLFQVVLGFKQKNSIQDWSVPESTHSVPDESDLLCWNGTVK